MEDINALTAIIQDLGVWAIFAYLFITERQRHEDTRKEYRDDLREIAGLRARLERSSDDLTG